MVVSQILGNDGGEITWSEGRGAGDASAQGEEMVLFVCLPSAVEGDADDEGKEDAQGGWGDDDEEPPDVVGFDEEGKGGSLDVLRTRFFFL